MHQGFGKAEENILQLFGLQVIKFLHQQQAFLALSRIPMPEYDRTGLGWLFPVDVNRQRQGVIAVEGVGQEEILRGELLELSVAQEAYEGALEMSCKRKPCVSSGGRNWSRIRG